MSKELELIAEHHAEHGEAGSQQIPGCWCGWQGEVLEHPPWHPIPGVADALHAAHVVSKLSEHGYCIVQLPKPEATHALESGESYRTFRVWASDSPVLAFSDGDVSFDDVGDMTVDDARELGLALLAAAAAAEEDR